MKRTLFIISILFVAVAALIPAASAQAPCTPLQGGGQKADGTSYCMEAVMAIKTTQPSEPAASQNWNQGQIPETTTQTKGGLSVQSIPSIQKQPNTGPESLALLGMGPLAALGWYLRKKTA